jgi:diadenosine tetraphosphate (Ap4A) HIT family hydrolase
MFTLDARLERDTIAVAESPLSLLRLFNDERYFWVVLVPKVANVSEWFELAEPLQKTLMDEALACGKVIGAQPGNHKVNMGALGNIVRQLHVHVLGRHEGDPAWPGPVWGHSPAVPMGEALVSARIQTLKNSALGLRFSFTGV